MREWAGRHSSLICFILDLISVCLIVGKHAIYIYIYIYIYKNTVKIEVKYSKDLYSPRETSTRRWLCIFRCLLSLVLDDYWLKLAGRERNMERRESRGIKEGRNE